MEYILAKEHADRLAVIDEVKDEKRKKELRMEDEEEDFLDEGKLYLEQLSTFTSKLTFLCVDSRHLLLKFSNTKYLILYNC